MQQINWGIIGPGSIASAFAYSIQGASNSKLISVYGRSKDKTKSFANKFEIAAHHDLTEFIKDAKIDAVYIATPHSEHFIFSLEAITNGKHVLCEKPFTMNAFESMTLLNLARSSNIFLMEAYMYRTHPQTKNILSNLNFIQDENKKILIEASFGFEADAGHAPRPTHAANDVRLALQRDQPQRVAWPRGRRQQPQPASQSTQTRGRACRNAQRRSQDQRRHD